MIPPLRGGDFQGMAGLSSDDSLLVGVSTARKRSFNNRPRAVKHRLDEPGQIIPQHGCVPALPASVLPGSGNFSRKSKVVRAAQNQASVIAHRGLEVKLLFSTSGRGRNIFLDIPLYRTGDFTHNPGSGDFRPLRTVGERNRDVTSVALPPRLANLPIQKKTL